MIVLWEGVFPVVAVVLENGRCPVEEFLEKLPRRSRRPVSRAKMDALFERLASGTRMSAKRFKWLRDGIFELRHDQVRILGFRDGSRWVLTHGLIKKRDELPAREIERAVRLRDLYLEGGR